MSPPRPKRVTERVTEKPPNVMTESDKSNTTIHKTFCGICSSGTTHCGINATVRNGMLVDVEGMKEHPANEGTLCVKGASSCQYVYHPQRLRHPMKRVEREAPGNGRKSHGAKRWRRSPTGFNRSKRSMDRNQ